MKYHIKELINDTWIHVSSWKSPGEAFHYIEWRKETMPNSKYDLVDENGESVL